MDVPQLTFARSSPILLSLTMRDGISLQGRHFETCRIRGLLPYILGYSMRSYQYNEVLKRCYRPSW